ncbi:MAG: serine/threonine protein kinase [Marmoricola sp.]|nr:serine/threonine protein kinase [Marmoricola sp.]
MRRTAARTVLTLTAALIAGVGAGVGAASSANAAPSAGTTPSGLRDVMWVGNNWAGTASIVDARKLQVLRRGVDLVPDKAQELADIQADPARLAFYLAIQQGPGEGHDQYVDDMFTTRDGRYLAVSRPSFADVVWIDVAKAVAGRTDSIVREQQMDGYRTDHMGLSPDGRRLLVSDSTQRQVIEFSMVSETVGGTRIAMGDRLRSFESGETPHESNFTEDGSRIFHASIGKVYTPGDETGAGPVKIGPLHDALKGDRWFQIVDNANFGIKQRWDMGKELAEAGYPGMSSAVRPMALAPDERFVYFQVSYFHGLVEFDTQARDLDGVVTYTAGGIPEPRTGAVRRVVNLPNRVPSMPREQYVNDSAHHGLSMDQKGSTLCAAGTMDDYAALVDRRTMTPTIFDTASTGHSYGKPYWTTEGLGDTCWVSLSEADAVAVLSFDQRKELAYLPVGDHPQRIRHGFVSERVLAARAPVGAATAAATAASVLDAGSRLGRIDDSPAPGVTSAQEVDLQLVGSQSVPWLTLMGLLALLLVSTALRSAQARMTRRRA